MRASELDRRDRALPHLPGQDVDHLAAAAAGLLARGPGWQRGQMKLLVEPVLIFWMGVPQTGQGWFSR